MANSLFDKFRESLLSQAPSVDLDTDAIRVGLVRGYTPSFSTHQYLTDVTGSGASLVASQLLATKTVTAGVFRAANPTFPAVATGTACAHLLIYKDTGTASTSPLVAAIDTATGLPVTPNNGDITVTWDSGSNGIFRI